MPTVRAPRFWRDSAMPRSFWNDKPKDDTPYKVLINTNVINKAGAYPTKNFMWGRFDGCSKISGKTQAETKNARGGKSSATHGCHREGFYPFQNPWHG